MALITLQLARNLAIVAVTSLLCACAGAQNSPSAASGVSIAASHIGAAASDPLATLSTSASTDTVTADSTSGTALHSNETQGYGANRLLTFTYQQSFDCVDQANEDRNYNGVPAEQDPAEFYVPRCQIGAPNTLSPSGQSAAQTDKLYVLVPFFETNPSQPAFTPQLGATLKKLFGFVPDAFKIHPGVPVQCPEPGPPITPFQGKPGTCTMHPIAQDLGPVLTALHLVPPKTVVDTPLVNHSHLLDSSQITQSPEWWQVIVVLVKNKNYWPNRAGTSGITSLTKLREAQEKGFASPDVASNFYLFFSSRVMASMPGM